MEELLLKTLPVAVRELVKKLRIPTSWLGPNLVDIDGKPIKKEAPKLHLPEIREITEILGVGEDTAGRIEELIRKSAGKGSRHREIANAILTSVEGVDKSKEHALMTLLLGRDNAEKAEKIISTLCRGISESTCKCLVPGLVLQEFYISDLNEFVREMGKVTKYEQTMGELVEKSPAMEAFFATMRNTLLTDADRAKALLREGKVSEAAKRLTVIQPAAAVMIYNYRAIESLTDLDEQLGNDSKGSEFKAPASNINPKAINEHLIESFFNHLGAGRVFPALWWLSGLDVVQRYDSLDENFDVNIEKVLNHLATLARVTNKWVHTSAESSKKTQKIKQPEALGEIFHDVEDLQQQLLLERTKEATAYDELVAKHKAEILRGIQRAKELRREFKKISPPIPDDNVISTIVSLTLEKRPQDAVEIIKKYGTLGASLKERLTEKPELLEKPRVLGALSSGNPSKELRLVLGKSRKPSKAK